MGSLFVSAFLLLTVVVPTTFDRSDINTNTNEVIVKRSVTNNPVFAGGGWFEGTIDMHASQISAIGFVDHVNSTYEVDAHGILTYQTTYRTFASVSPTFGFFVQLNDEIILVGGGPYTQDTATIRVERIGSGINYYLNGQLMYTSQISGHLSLRGCVIGFDGATDLLLDRGELQR